MKVFLEVALAGLIALVGIIVLLAVILQLLGENIFPLKGLMKDKEEEDE